MNADDSWMDFGKHMVSLVVKAYIAHVATLAILALIALGVYWVYLVPELRRFLS